MGFDSDAGAVLLIVGIVCVGFFLFCIYFILKQLEYVLVSVNLFRKMVQRQDAIMRILIDMRDGTRGYRLSRGLEDPDDDEGDEPASIPYDATVSGDDSGAEAGDGAFCFHCGAELAGTARDVCPQCGKRI